jgi:type II secretory pathway pseudopilin PulG
LVELLVVMSIMVLLVAVSVPMLKPMFKSQKTKNAAETVAAALQRVRFKAMEEQETYGISFEPFDPVNYQNVVVQMRLVKMGTPVLNSQDIRIIIASGVINFCVYDQDHGQVTRKNDDGDPDPDTNYYWTTNPNTSAKKTARANAKDEWDAKVRGGYEIQLARQGKVYKLDSPSNLAFPYHSLTLPADVPVPPPTYFNNALEYNIVQQPRSTLSPPVVLPKGTVVDLNSGYSSVPFGYGPSYEIPINSANKYLLFTPNGNIDYFQGYYKPCYGGLIYLCIGEWERGIGAAEDNKDNIQTLTNFWVTLNPKTGQVRITEMAPHDNPGLGTALEKARKYAAEHYGIHEE